MLKYSGLPPKSENSGKIGEFIFNQGKSRGKERYFRVMTSLYSVTHQVECDNCPVPPFL